jgi:CHASE3 domain sensor protein
MKNLNWRAKIALLFVAPFYIGVLVCVLIISASYWLLAQLLQLTGILDAFIYLLNETLKANKRIEFRANLDPLDRAVMDMKIDNK